MSKDLDELDRLAAEKIMGWTSYSYADDPWQPTRNIAQAWELLEKLAPVHVRIEQRGTDQTNWRCYSYSMNGSVAEAETAPLAIVKACLLAKGIEF